MADALIPIADAVAAVWPDARGMLRVRIASTISAEQRAWLAKRGGRVEVIDTTGNGDAAAWYSANGRAFGWASADEIREQLCLLDCPTGDWARRISKAFA